MKRIALLAAANAVPMVAFANKAAAAPAPEPAATATREAPKLSGVLSIALPERARKTSGNKTIYPFDSLTAVGQFFAVHNKDKRGMTSVVSNQNKRHKVKMTDAAGNVVFNTKTLTGPDGSKTEVPDASDPKMTFTKKFEVREVDAAVAEAIKGTEAEGAKVLIVRTV